MTLKIGLLTLTSTNGILADSLVLVSRLAKFEAVVRWLK